MCHAGCRVLALPLPSWVTEGRLLNRPVPQRTRRETGQVQVSPPPEGCREENVNRHVYEKASFSFAARALGRLACRMAGQPSHMPPGGNPNNLCHTPGPAHPPDPQVSPFPLPTECWSVTQVPEATWSRLLEEAPRQRLSLQASGDGSGVRPPASSSFTSSVSAPRSLSVLDSGWVPGLALPLGVSISDQRHLEGLGGAEEAVVAPRRERGCRRVGSVDVGSKSFLTLGEVCLLLWSEPCSSLLASLSRTSRAQAHHFPPTSSPSGVLLSCSNTPCPLHMCSQAWRTFPDSSSKEPSCSTPSPPVCCLCSVYSLGMATITARGRTGGGVRLRRHRMLWFRQPHRAGPAQTRPSRPLS